MKLSLSMNFVTRHLVIITTGSHFDQFLDHILSSNLRQFINFSNKMAGNKMAG